MTTCAVCSCLPSTFGCTLTRCAWAVATGASSAQPGGCGECGDRKGLHRYTCSQFPKNGNQHCCTGCSWYNRTHHPGCPTKGYQVPARVDPDGPATERLVAKCDCGSNEPNCHSDWCSAK